MDVLAIILSCSLYHDDALVERIVNVTSDACAMYVREHDSDMGFPFDRSDDAMSAVNKLRDEKKIPHIGLMGIRPDTSREFSVSAAKLFDPCMNIAIGSELLSGFESKCTALGITDVTPCALKEYALMLGKEPNSFALNVMFKTIHRNDKSEDIGDTSERSGVIFGGIPSNDNGGIFFKY